MWKQYNPNPYAARVGDCTIRALTKATGQSWEKVYVDLSLQGYAMGDMPSANAVWGAYLKRHGFKRSAIPNDCPDCYTLGDFANDHKHGVYVVCMSGHVVCVEDGDIYDSWDSSGEIPVFFWRKEG